MGQTASVRRRGNLLPVFLVAVGCCGGWFYWNHQRRQQDDSSSEPVRAGLVQLEEALTLGPAAVPEFLAWLDSGEVDQRLLGAEGLERLGVTAMETEPRLLTMVKDTNEAQNVRLRALAALYQFDPGGPNFNEWLIPILEVRPEAGEPYLMELCRNSAHAPFFMEAAGTLLAHDDIRLRYCGIKLLERSGSVEPEMVRRIRRLLTSDDERERQTSFDLLLRDNIASTDDFILMMNAGVSDAFHESVSRQLDGDRIVAELASHLQSDIGAYEDDGTLPRWSVVQALQRRGTGAAAARPVVERALAVVRPESDEAGSLQALLILAATRLGCEFSAVQELLDVQLQADPVRPEIGRTLVEIPAESQERFIKELIADLPSKPGRVIGALAECGLSASDAATQLPKLIVSEESEIQRAAIDLASKLGPLAENCVPALMEVVAVGSNGRAAIVALGNIGPAANDALSVLLPEVQTLSHSARRDCQLAIQTVGRIGALEPDVQEALIRQMERGASSAEQCYALQALARLYARDQPDALNEFLEPFLERRSLGKRVYAIRELGSISDQTHAIDLLIEQLDVRDPYVQSAAAETLGRFGAAAKQALPMLRELGESPSSRRPNYRGRRRSSRVDRALVEFAADTVWESATDAIVAIEAAIADAD